MSWHDLLRTRASGWVTLIRLMVGLAVFFPEGIQKLIFPEILGAGRFTRIGIPLADVMGPFVGVVETVCGALYLLIEGAGAWSLDAWLSRGRRRAAV